MPAVVFALLGATCYASSAVIVKFAARSGNPRTGFLVGLVSSLLAIGAASPALVTDWTIPAKSVALFAAAGVTGAGAGRALGMWGVRLAGASVAVPVQASANPLIATAAGAFLFTESVGYARLGAIGLILIGVWLAARGGTANLLDLTNDGQPRSRWLVVVPLAAGATFGATDVLRKLALGAGGDPALGALIGLVVATLMWGTLLAPRSRRPPLRPNRSWWWYGLYGVVTMTAQLCVLLALRSGDISTVSPILSSQPVIVLLLSGLFLRRIERLRPGTVIGAAVVVAGVMWITRT